MVESASYPIGQITGAEVLLTRSAIVDLIERCPQNSTSTYVLPVERKINISDLAVSNICIESDSMWIF